MKRLFSIATFLSVFAFTACAGHFVKPDLKEDGVRSRVLNKQ